MTSNRRRIASGIVVAAVVVGAIFLQRQHQPEKVTLAIELGADHATVTRLELDLTDESQHLARRIDLRWPEGRAPITVERLTQLQPGAYAVTARVYKNAGLRLAEDHIRIVGAGTYPVRLGPAATATAPPTAGPDGGI